MTPTITYIRVNNSMHSNEEIEIYDNNGVERSLEKQDRTQHILSNQQFHVMHNEQRFSYAINTVTDPKSITIENVNSPESDVLVGSTEFNENDYATPVRFSLETGGDYPGAVLYEWNGDFPTGHRGRAISVSAW